MNQQALEAAAKSIYGDVRKHPSPAWAELDHVEKGSYLWMAKRSITAYAEATGERVVATNQTGKHVSVTIPELDARFWVFIGESVVVVRKVGTDGK